MTTTTKTTARKTIADLMPTDQWQAKADLLEAAKVEYHAHLEAKNYEAAFAIMDRISHGNHSGPAYWITNADGTRELVCSDFEREVTPAPYVGMPCTVILYSDTVAAVVTKVNGSSVNVQYVRTEAPVVTSHYGPFPRTTAQGITTEPYGETQRFTLNKHGRFANGTIGLRLGTSSTYTDYSF